MAQKRDLLTLLEFTPDETVDIIVKAQELKQNRLIADPKIFKERTGVLLFEKPSLRTRITFETALHELGGHVIYLANDSVQMGKRESVDDVAKNLERWVHLIVARTFRHETIEKLASASSIPVINALSDAHHPCQALALGLTLYERFGRKQNITIVFVGDGNNVCHSLMVLCAQLGYSFVAACPRGYEPDPVIVATCNELAQKWNKSIIVTDDVAAAMATATVVYTDVWASMGQEHEAEHRRKIFAPYQINRSLLERAPADVLVSHCLPAHRGEEITAEVLDSDRSIALDEAENRLHVQKAVIVKLFS